MTAILLVAFLASVASLFVGLGLLGYCVQRKAIVYSILAAMYCMVCVYCVACSALSIVLLARGV